MRTEKDAEKDYPINLAIFSAKMSCLKFNNAKWYPRGKMGKAFKKAVVDKFYERSRQRYRDRLWEMARTFWETGERQYWVRLLKGHGDCYSTYPWPYCDPKLDDWCKGVDTLVYDPSGNVVKDSTSYCSWKIYELTGKWPNRKANLRVSARYWQYFLSRAGYTEIVERPENGHHYVGIEPRDGDEGMTFWFEKAIKKSGNVVVSTYRDRHFNQEVIKKDRIQLYIWIPLD